MTTPNEREKVIAEMHHHVEHDGCACCRTKDWADRLASEQREGVFDSSVPNAPFGWVKDGETSDYLLPFTVSAGIAEEWKAQGYRVLTLYSLPHRKPQPEAPGAVAMWRAMTASGKWMYFDHEPTHMSNYQRLYTTPPAPVDVRKQLLRMRNRLDARRNDVAGGIEGSWHHWQYQTYTDLIEEIDGALLDGQQAGVDANYHVRAHSDRALGEAGWMVLDDPAGFMRYPANFDYRVTYTAALGGGERKEKEKIAQSSKPFLLG